MATAALRLALDQNFPSDLIRQITDYLPEQLELRSLQQIDARLTRLDDRPLIIALRQLGWDGLITNNYRMLYEPHEVAAIVATRVTHLARAAERHGEDRNAVWQRHRPSEAELGQPVLQ